MIGVAVVVTLGLALVPPRSAPDVREVPVFDLGAIDAAQAKLADDAIRYRRHRGCGPLIRLRSDFADEIAASVDAVR